MDHIRPGRRLFKHMAVGNGQTHPLAGDQMLHYREKPHLPHGVLIVGGLAGGNDPHLVAVVPEGLGKAAGADGSSVIGVVKLVNDQYDLHISYRLSSGLTGQAEKPGENFIIPFFSDVVYCRSR